MLRLFWYNRRKACGEETQMYRFLAIFIGVACVGVIFVPVFLAVRGRALRRESKLRVCLLLGIGLYFAAVFSVTGIPDICSLVFEPNFHFLPFTDIVNSPLSYVRNCLLNVVLFVPLGMIAPILWEKFRSLRGIALLGFGVSLFIEVSQIFTFRLTDIDDLVMNTAGAALGFLLLDAFGKKGSKMPPEENQNGKGKKEFEIMFGAVFLLMFLVTPFLSGIIWEMIL